MVDRSELFNMLGIKLFLFQIKILQSLQIKCYKNSLKKYFAIQVFSTFRRIFTLMKYLTWKSSECAGILLGTVRHVMQIDDPRDLDVPMRTKKERHFHISSYVFILFFSQRQRQLFHLIFK